MGPKVLIVDIETAPIEAYCWGLWDQNIALNQIKSDWAVIAWAAKWLGDPEHKTMYRDQRKAKNVRDDKSLLKDLWKLIDEADILITQNGVAFDSKKLNARFALHGWGPPSPVKHIDTCKLAKQHFAFTSNKLEYLSDKLCVKYKKIKHAEFGGFELWKECLAGNLKAWKVMELYNRHDVLATEELYEALSPWQTQMDFNIYSDRPRYHCNCGSSDLQKRGFSFTPAGKFQRYQCQACGAWTSDKGAANNLLKKDKKSKLQKKVV